MMRLIKQLTALAVVVAALAALPSFASATSCNFDGSGPNSPDNDPSLVDGAGFSWDMTNLAEIAQGYHNGTNREDAFDIFGLLELSGDNGATFDEYTNSDPATCTLSENGRQITYPDDEVTIPGLAAGRSVYVTASGPAFLRYVDTFTNTSDDAETIVYRFGGDLGSDGETTLAATSSGDNLMTEDDSWVDSFENPLGALSDPLVTTVWDGTATPVQRARKAGRFDPHAPGFDQVLTEMGVEYSISLAPGETKRYMHLVAMRLTLAEQAAASAELAAQPDDLRVGLTNAEQDNIQNWSFDRDEDGVKDRADNCASNANASQEDLDRDAKGDVCDDDIDGDGISNATESSLRTDPRHIDTDADGVGDSADSCPTLAASTADGCPAAAAPAAPVVIPQVDKTAPVASIAVAKSVSLKTLLRKGIVVKLGSNEPASFEVEVAAAAKSARLAQVGDLIVSAKRLAFGAGTRSAKLTIAKKFRNALTPASRLRIRVVATDAAGNRTVKSVRLRLER